MSLGKQSNMSHNRSTIHLAASYCSMIIHHHDMFKNSVAVPLKHHLWWRLQMRGLNIHPDISLHVLLMITKKRVSNPRASWFHPSHVTWCNYNFMGAAGIHCTSQDSFLQTVFQLFDPTFQTFTIFLPRFILPLNGVQEELPEALQGWCERWMAGIEHETKKPGRFQKAKIEKFTTGPLGAL